jgi:hypothetical protein
VVFRAGFSLTSPALQKLYAQVRDVAEVNEGATLQVPPFFLESTEIEDYVSRVVEYPYLSWLHLLLIYN